MSATAEPYERRSVLLQGGRTAEMLSVRQEMDTVTVLKALEIPEMGAAIIVTGNTKPFPPPLENRLMDLLGRGVAQAAVESNAILIDDGTKEGVSAIVGQGVADRGGKSKLIGVLPQGKSAGVESPAGEQELDPNHTHFIRDEQEKDVSQAVTMSRLAEVASCNKDWILTILVGGEMEGASLDMVLQAVRRGWQLLVIEGSGPLADEITRLKREAQKVEKRTGRTWKYAKTFFSSNPLTSLRETNPRLYEILSDGKIIIIGTSFDAIQLRNLIKGIFTHPPKENILWTAWQKFAEYDKNSGRHRSHYHWLKNVPLVLGVLSTVLVLIYSVPMGVSLMAEGDPSQLGGNLAGEVARSQLWANWYVTFMGGLATLRLNPYVDLFFRFVIILLPISITIIMGIETRLKLGSKYILLRGAAEAVKRGIYSYRVLENREGNTPELLLPYNRQMLATHLAKISKYLSESDVNEAAFTPYEGRIPPNMFGAEAYDDGFSPLDPETYLKIRVGDQLKFYTKRTMQYEKRIRRLQTSMLIFGGIGTFLAAVGAQYWLPFSAAIVSAATAYLEYQQLEQILTKYNLTKASLETARANWLALSDEERPKNIQRLVREVEAILESENQGWVQFVSQVQEGQGQAVA